MSIETLTLHISFNKEMFIKENTFRIKLVQKPVWRHAYGIIIMSSLLLLLTVFLYSTDQPNPVFLIITIVLCIVTIIYISGIQEVKQKYLKKINELGTKYEQSQNDGTYEFNDEGINYTDKIKAMNFKWDIFKQCVLIDDYIAFMVSESFDNAWFLSRQEMEKNDWEKMLEIVATKLPIKTISIK